MSNGNGKERDYKADYERLHRVLVIQEQGIARQNTAYSKLQTDYTLLINVNLSLEKQIMQLKTINQTAIAVNNETQQQNAGEISRLRTQVKGLGGNPG